MFGNVDGGRATLGVPAVGLTGVFATTFGTSVDKFSMAVDKFALLPTSSGRTEATHPQDKTIWYYTHGLTTTREEYYRSISKHARVDSGATPPEAGVSSVPYADLINQAAAKFGIPAVAIAAIIKAESNFNPNAINRASGAVGLGQVMPSDAPGYGRMFAGRPTTQQLLDPATNIEWTARILASAWRATGSWEGAAARYFGIGRDAQGTTTSMALERYNRALQSLGGMSDRPLRVQGITQLGSAVEGVASRTSQVNMTTQAGFARLGMVAVQTNMLLTNILFQLARIATLAARPAQVSVTINGSATDRRTVQQSGQSGTLGGTAGANIGTYVV
jgi:hypothetical protein